MHNVTQYSSMPSPVEVIYRPDGVAECRLTKGVTTDTEGVISGEEVYFEITYGAQGEFDTELVENFEAWWAHGEAWGRVVPNLDSPPSQDDRLSALEEGQLDMAELQAEMLYQICLMEMGVNFDDL